MVRRFFIVAIIASRGVKLFDVCCLSFDWDVHPGIEAILPAFSHSATEKRRSSPSDEDRWKYI